jgi:hypothetical protein
MGGTQAEITSCTKSAPMMSATLPAASALPLSNTKRVNTCKIHFFPGMLEDSENDIFPFKQITSATRTAIKHSQRNNKQKQHESEYQTLIC